MFSNSAIIPLYFIPVIFRGEFLLNLAKGVGGLATVTAGCFGWSSLAGAREATLLWLLTSFCESEVSYSFYSTCIKLREIPKPAPQGTHQKAPATFSVAGAPLLFLLTCPPYQLALPVGELVFVLCALVTFGFGRFWLCCLSKALKRNWQAVGGFGGKAAIMLLISGGRGVLLLS